MTRSSRTRRGNPIAIVLALAVLAAHVYAIAAAGGLHAAVTGA